MADAILPRAQSAPNGGGPFTREWYDFFRSIQPLTADNVELQAEIDAILVRLSALEDAPTDTATINGLASVEVFGSLESGLVQIQLDGDTDTPGNTYYYGTGPDGTKGWSTIASAFTEGTGITLTVGADGVTDIAHEDTSSVVDISANFTGGTVPDEISFTFDEFGHVLTRTISGRTLDHNDTGALQGGTAGEFYHLTSAEYTKVQALPSASQPLDATLTALAGQNWAQNAFPIGTGADTVAQVTFAANTFPARASTGDLSAKSITDFSLSLLDDADAATARSTLEAMPLKLTVAGTNVDYTYVAADANLARGKTTSTARTYTVDCSVLTVGAYYYAMNYASTGNVTVTAAVGTTLRLAGTATTGDRTVGPFGAGRIWIRSATEAWVDGPGVT